jgi:hypothetical protein
MCVAGWLTRTLFSGSLKGTKVPERFGEDRPAELLDLLATTPSLHPSCHLSTAVDIIGTLRVSRGSATDIRSDGVSVRGAVSQ